MKSMLTIARVIGVVVLVGLAQPATAQQASATRIVGRETSQKLDIKPQAKTIDTFTLTFGAPGSATAFDVQFVAQYASQGARTAPEVVDVVVTERQAEDSQPALSITVDGASMPVVARTRYPRSIVTSLAFDDFMRIATAGTVVEHAFGTDLVFGDGQRRMLRLTAEKWAGR
jgi:hypothetical protein